MALAVTRAFNCGIADVTKTPAYCGHCGFYHAPPCPRIKAIEYHPDGSVKRIEYHEWRSQ
jgi:hypothetical protein